MPRAVSSGSRRQISKIGQGVYETKKGFHPGHLQGIANPFIDCQQDQVATFFLMSDECAYERPYASRIDIGNSGEIENEGFRAVGSHHSLKFKQIGHQDRSREAQKALPWLWSGQIFSRETFFWHASKITKGRMKAC